MSPVSVAGTKETLHSAWKKRCVSLAVKTSLLEWLEFYGSVKELFSLLGSLIALSLD